jgi:alpha-methylacyl-CoA racemase
MGQLGPFLGLILADYGACVLRVKRPGAEFSMTSDLVSQKKSTITLDLRDPSCRNVLLSLISTADVLIDPFRPGVLERLELSPTDVLQRQNSRLIIARMTGFRRDGMYKNMAGHDINYIAVSGVLSLLGRAGQRPYAPGNIVGDFAGGSAMCLSGILMALIERERTGQGQIVEVNMVDGSAYLATIPRLARATSFWNAPRGCNMLDGGCPFYDTYETKDEGKYFAVGALEERFYATLLKGLALNPENLPSRDKKNWPVLRAIFEKRFKEKTREEWEEIFNGTDACATPVLDYDEIDQRGHGWRPAFYLKDSHSLNSRAENNAHRKSPVDNENKENEADVLRTWLGWRKGSDYTVRDDGASVSLTYRSTKL